MKRRFEVMAAARSDLTKIRTHLTREAGQRTAAVVMARLRERIAFARERPLAGPPIAELGVDVRMLVSQRWVIYYEVTNQCCRILRVLDGAQDRDSVFERG